jgi:DNA-3-methyladenine glycosylase
LATAARRAGGRKTSARIPLEDAFFERSVHDVARDLVGCELAHGRTAGIIVETESYHAADEACHAFNGLTPRNRVLFGPPAHAYVYLSYGIHSCLNFVCEPDGDAAAVLVRALEPLRGLALMRSRRGLSAPGELCSGPGKLTQALGIGLELDGVRLRGGPLRVYERSGEWTDPRVVTGPRIGITRAVDLPWRFCAAGSRFVSRPRLPSP